MQIRLHTYYSSLSIAIYYIFAINLYGCSTGDEPNRQQSLTDTPTATCDLYQTKFNSEIWPILQNNCFSCHEQNNVSGDFSLLRESFINYQEINFTIFQQVAGKQDINGISLILSKPTDINNDHGGGQNFTNDSSEYRSFENMVSGMETCTSDVSRNTDLIMETDYGRLRKITFALAGRLPTLQEEQRIAAASGNNSQTEIEFDGILDGLMTEEYFFERLKTIFNDRLLLDAFPGTDSLNEFDLINFVNKDYFDSVNLDQYYDTSTRNIIRNEAGYGLSQAPLELIAHVVRENRPFTEILTADYLLVNPYSATILNADVGDPTFNFAYGDDPELIDHTDFREAHLVASVTDTVGGVVTGDAIPQAGIISSFAFLRRYPSTSTNRNRTRSRHVYLYFLDIDIDGLARRDSLDLDNVIGGFPTLEDPQCKVCHDTLDPLAGLFKNRRSIGRYRGDFTLTYTEGNNPEMLKPGFSIDIAHALPAAYSANALQWLAQHVVNEPGFPLSAVKILFKGFIGKEIPQDAAFIESLKSTFVDSNFDLKTLIKEIINSDYFLVNNLIQPADASEYAEYGMAHLLTPEQLNQKILSLTNGYKWQAPSSQRDLLDVHTFRVLYGGIDSEEIVTRTTQPTSLMVGIQERIANQTACNVVPADFSLPVNRIFFPVVEINDTPETTSGSERIKQNLVYLHKYLLGEELTVTDAEIIRSYDLFVSVRNLTTGTNIPEDCDSGLDVSNPIRIDADRTVRPWMAIIAYLLSDYRFLYE